MNPGFCLSISLLLFALSAVKSEKIGVFLSTLSSSQILFGTQLAEVLRSDGHDLVLIRPQMNPEATLSRGNFREIRFDALNGRTEVFTEFHRSEQEVIFGDHGFFSPIFVRFGAAFRQLLNVSCVAIVSNTTFLRELEHEKFDLIYVNHHLNCGMAVARHLNVRYIRFSSASLGRTLANPAGIPPVPSVTPAWLAPFSDQMTYWERAMNLFLTIMESGEDFSLDRLSDVYRAHFGPQFPRAQELSRDAELLLVNDEELFNYPRLVSHKVVYIGGLTQEAKTEIEPVEQEYTEFIGDRQAVLVSLGSVANSTQMPQEWKYQLVKMFGLMENVRFIWKYDGEDIETKSNVLVKRWVPQNELLKGGKISAFLTHAGCNSLSESLYSAVPLVLLPTFADQLRNANLAKVRGVGVVVKKSEVRAEVLVDRISTVLNNSSFAASTRKFQKLLKSKPFTAREQIVRWNRFILENSVDLNVKTLGFVQYYCLDVIVPVVLIFSVLTTWLVYKLLGLYYWSCFGMQKKSTHSKKD